MTLSLSVSAVVAIAVPAAEVYREPDATSEVVTTALLNMSAQIEELVGMQPEQWARIRLCDYEGWVPTAFLSEPAISREWLATILPLSATIYADPEGDQANGSAYATTVLPAGEKSAERVPVQLPGGGERVAAWFPGGASSRRHATSAIWVGEGYFAGTAVARHTVSLGWYDESGYRLQRSYPALLSRGRGKHSP